MELWSPPPESGDPIGCIATSFTFDPVFFEEECLSRFLKMESDPDEDGPVFIIEREEKMAVIRCAAAVVDQHYAKGKRSLRWELLDVRMPKGIMHAKIIILHWAKLIRVIIGSANLTPQGYRLNQEVFGVLDYYDGSEAPLSALREVGGFVKTVIQSGVGLSDSPGGIKCVEYLDSVVRAARRWGRAEPYTGSKDVRLVPILSGPRLSDVFEQLQSNWNSVTSRPPKEAFITSPFFDSPESENRPARKIWEVLNQRGMAKVAYSVKILHSENGKAIVLQAPESLNYAPANRADVSVDFCEMKESVKMEKAEVIRPLHLKSIWLQNEDWVLYLIGSSNFTSAGTGISRIQNYEANLVYLASITQNQKMIDRMIESTVDEDKLLDKDKLKWQDVPNEDELGDESFFTLPAGFQYAVYNRNEKNEAAIELYFDVSQMPERFTIRGENGLVVFEHKAWLDQKKPAHAIVSWHEPLAPSGFEVVWDAQHQPVWWPVQAASPSVLPPVPDLRDLPLEVLITILTSARSLHTVLSSWIRKKTNTHDTANELDPHKRVDTTKFLFQRTRQIAWALNALHTKLQRPCYTIESLKWRLYGPVGIMALVRAIQREGKSEQEKAFLISEIALELGQIIPSADPGSLPVEEVQQGLKILIEELRVFVQNITITDPLVERYVRTVFNKALS